MRNSFKKSKKDYKKSFIKINSILLVFIFVLGLVVTQPSKGAHADEIRQIADDVKPKIDVKYLGTDPQEPLVGQDIEVSYQITPHPFQHNISKPKEIVLVLVLDGSGSMKGNKLTELKSAAKTFIDKLKYIENLKIGIVVYSSDGTINPISVGKDRKIKHVDGNNRTVPGYKSLENEYLLDVKDRRLYTMIDNIKAVGGTNTGEGIRKGEFLLQQGQDDANKTLVLMSDGLPTYYSVLSSKDRNYYTKIDKSYPIIDGKGNENSVDNINKSTEYAKTIGNIVKNKGYNIFSIGYGLGAANSNGNKKMQEIHKSMGGIVNIDNPDDVNNTFFASNEGAIDSIFKKIADKLEQFYNFNDANLQVNLDENFTAIEGFEVGSDSNTIKVPPIVYELTEINGVKWYKAEPIAIKFKVKANKAGEYPIFNSNSNLEYTDINGNNVSVPIEEHVITVKEFTPEDKQKLQVNFYPDKNGYLIGDYANVNVGFTHPGTSEITFDKAVFDITDGIPEGIELIESNEVLNFGKVESNTPNQKYKFNIEDNISENQVNNYKLTGKYSYDVKNKGSVATIAESKDTSINVKRGQVKVNIKDVNGKIIKDANIKVSLKGGYLDEELSQIKNGVVSFDVVPTGNYNLSLTKIPIGYEYINGSDAIVRVDYENNIAEYTFILKNNIDDGKVTIEASDSSGKVDNVYNSNEGNDYRYDKFIKDDFGNEYKLFGQSYADIKFLGENLNYLQYQILKSDSNPTTMPEEGWTVITDDDDGSKDDIDISQAGKLTQKAYSVFHMKELNSEGYNPNDWKNRELVYKYPFDGVRYVDASVAEKKEEYTIKREIINPVTNLPEDIWEPQKVFTKTFDYTGENYKEASKTWGYFKAPETGFYYFGTHSDDGIRFSITNDDGTNLLVDNFEPHGPKFDIATKSVKLEKDKYYPIFIEYFNVGGAAEYGVKYVVSDKENMTHTYESYKYVDPVLFFPSKSTAPGESSEGSFEGESKIMFPEEDGKYYVAYRGFNKDNNKDELIKEGFYGPFIVEDRFTLERIVENNSTNLEDDFKIKYKITPKDIRVTDLYKTKEELKEESVKDILDIKNMYLKDTIPEGITVNNIYIEPEGVKSTTNIDEKNSTIDVRFGVNKGETTVDPIGIQYNLSRETNEAIEKAIYKSEPIIVTIDVSADLANEYVFENKVGKLIYDDISLKAEKMMKESYFGETKFELKDSGSIDIKYVDYNPTPTVGDEFDVKYEILPKPFKGNNESEDVRDEIVLVLDASKSMDGDKLNKLKEDATNFITKINTIKGNYIKIGLVVYGASATVNPGVSIEESKLLIKNTEDRLKNVVEKMTVLEGENVGEALRKAEYLLTESTTSDESNKTIILMSDGLPTNYSVNKAGEYYTDINNETPQVLGIGTADEDNYVAKSTEYALKMANVIKDNGHRVFTIEYGLDDSNIDKNMRELHSSMGGLDDEFFKSDESTIDSIIEKMKPIDLAPKAYIFKDVELKFTTADEFTEVSGFGEDNGKSHVIKLGEIVYNFNEQTKQYESNIIPKIFKIKADKPGKYTILNSKRKNRLEYTDIDGKKVSVKMPNPEIVVADNIYDDLKHGLYEGISGMNINIMESNDKVIAAGTNVNFGSTFKAKANVPKITLTVDEKYENIKNMKVYKLEGSKLVEIKDAKITTANNNVYNVVLSKGVKVGTDILIRYSAKLPKGKNATCTNNIKVGASEKSITVTTTNTEEKDRLPDLF